MHSSIPIAALITTAFALPKIPFLATTDTIPLPSGPVSLTSRQSTACFIIGSTPLPAEVSDVVTTLTNLITCSTSATTLSGVPDVTSGSTSFSSIDFTQPTQSTQQTPLEFALANFNTSDPVSDSDLAFFQDALNVYLATEAGIRSVGGDLAIKVPKFFLEMQVSRIETAQGDAPTEAGLQVDHLRDKVIKNAAGEDQGLLDQVTALAAQVQ
ncbi:hypothetical protein F5Y07DRAFT_413068 [Xylaria sp. FL0933]|nr:hypothetical protein F5Y07DRAFT_413068 [Xylaria sp. FL0933]